MTWINLHDDITDLFASEAPTSIDTYKNSRGEVIVRGLRCTTNLVTKRVRDSAWKAAHPERTRELDARARANRLEERRAYSRAYYHAHKTTSRPTGRPPSGCQSCKKCGKPSEGRVLCSTHRSQKYRSAKA